MSASVTRAERRRFWPAACLRGIRHQTRRSVHCMEEAAGRMPDCRFRAEGRHRVISIVSRLFRQHQNHLATFLRCGQDSNLRLFRGVEPHRFRDCHMQSCRHTCWNVLMYRGAVKHLQNSPATESYQRNPKESRKKSCELFGQSSQLTCLSSRSRIRLIKRSGETTRIIGPKESTRISSSVSSSRS